MHKWVLFIDVEGFSSIYRRNKAEATSLLSGLMSDLYCIGTKVYPDDKDFDNARWCRRKFEDLILRYQRNYQALFG